MHFKFNQQRYSESGFKAQLQKAWEENALCINYVIQYSVNENPITEQLQQRLINNQQEIGQLIGHFYNVKQDLAKMFIEFILLTIEAIKTLRWKINIKSFRKTWYEKTDSLVKVLDTFEKWNIRELFYQQISFTESLILAYIKNDSKEQAFFYDKLLNTSRSLAGVTTENIINSHRKYFGP